MTSTFFAAAMRVRTMWFDAIIVLGIVLSILLPVVFVTTRRRRRAEKEAPQLPLGEVRFIFHCYTGFLVWARQTRYDVVLPIEEANALLKRVVVHNLTRGLFVHGGIFVPILTYFEWRAQKKRIAAARQADPASRFRC